MATIVELKKQGALIRFDPQLEANEAEWRFIWLVQEVHPRFVDVPNWTSQWVVEESPAQQLDALAEIFCSGETLIVNVQFKCLIHLQDGVWELKTGDLRLFGWFAKKDHFICAAIDTAEHIKAHELYAGYAGQVKRARDALELNEPKFVSGENPDDVVSNYSYS